MSSAAADGLTTTRPKGAKVSVSLRGVGAITLFVDDRDRAKEFYERVFDGKLAFEDESSAAFHFDNTVINLLKSTEAVELIAPAAVADAAAGSRLQLTIWVDDADAACAELESRGVTLLNGPIDREWGLRTASFTDPDGHIWEVASELPQAGSD